MIRTFYRWLFPRTAELEQEVVDLELACCELYDWIVEHDVLPFAVAAYITNVQAGAAAQRALTGRAVRR